MATLQTAIQVLHEKYNIPHVVITSISLPSGRDDKSLCVVGSTMTSARQSRLFQIVFPAIDCYFCGTGDMFGALITTRMREAVEAVPGLNERASWLSDDDVLAQDLPLAKATERVLASMNEVLTRTREAMPSSIERTRASMTEEEKSDDAKGHYVKTKAAELQLVRNLECLRTPNVAFEVETI